ncbi:MAG TPA: 6-bladed beta-propeller [Terriglobales bacterium]|jgi:DNA-binding beta-propeller fold protein YncE|nr:6-bladed beta-propeller [Terriglobales bacterium]
MTPRKHITLIFWLAALSFLLAAAQPASAGKKKDNGAQAGPVNLVWPLPPDKPRIKFLTAYSSNYDIEPRKKRSWVDKMVGNADPNLAEMFDKAAGVASDSKGRVYIVSSQRAMLYILDKEKRQVIRVNGDRGLQFRTPLGVVVDAKDNFYVADAQMHMVFKFGPDAHLQGTLGGDSGLKNPTYMAIDERRQRLFVVDSQQHQVLIFNPDTLQLESKLGKRGTKKGEFNFPIAVAVAPDGSIAVTDTGSCSVQVFSPDLKFVRRIGRQGTRPGEFVRPKGLAYDQEGHLWVVDAAFNNFQIFSPDGKALMFVGAYGQNPGEFNLPTDIYIDKNNRVYVSDSLNARVQIFQFLGGD